MFDEFDVLEYIDLLTAKYNYRPLPDKVSASARQTYVQSLPFWCCLSGSRTSILTMSDFPLATGYTRIVVGDYGAFLEIEPRDMLLDSLIIQPGQEFRAYANQDLNIKYIWHTARDGCGIKIYEQLKGVRYADYKSGKFYISPHHVKIK